MSDGLDGALRAIASVDAPEGFSARVRARLDHHARASVGWLQLATAAVVILAVAAGWLALAPADGVPRDVPGRGARAAGPSAQPAGLPPPAMALEPAGEHVVGPVETGLGPGRPSVSRPRRPELTSPPRLDHERALAALAELAPVGPPSLLTAPVAIEAREIAPLAPIPPIDIPALGAGEGDRR